MLEASVVDYPESLVGRQQSSEIGVGGKVELTDMVAILVDSENAIVFAFNDV